jgi:hypothetical protein
MRPGFLKRGKDSSWVEKLMLPGLFGTLVAKIAGAMDFNILHLEMLKMVGGVFLIYTL